MRWKQICPTIILLIPCLFSCSNGFAGPFVRIKPHVYVGGGLGITRDVTDQPFVIENEYDQSYYNMNYDEKKRFFTRGQFRLNVLEIDRFSIGYMFWSHCRSYKTDLLEYWVMPGKSYPYSDDLNFHGITVQWDLRYPIISNRHVVPFLLAGTGTFYGSSKSCQFEITFDGTYYYIGRRFLNRDKQYSGYARIYGGGVVLFRYAYLYAGMVDFDTRWVPFRRGVDIILGVRI